VKREEMMESLEVGEHIQVEFIDVDSNEDWHKLDDEVCLSPSYLEVAGYVYKVEKLTLILYCVRSFECVCCNNDDPPPEREVDGFFFLVSIPIGCITKVSRKPSWRETHELA
jgi:hypothetical protein